MKNKNIPHSCEQNCRECQFAAQSDGVVVCHNSDITAIKCLFYKLYDEVIE